MKRVAVGLSILILCWIASRPGWATPSASKALCQGTLRVGFVDIDLGAYLPGQGSQLANPPGLFAQWIQAEAARLGCQVEMTRLPPARLLRAMQQGDIDIALAMAPTPEREAAWVFPRDAQDRIDARMALVDAPITLYARQDRQAALGWDGRGFAKPVIVGGAKGSAPLDLAKSRGWNTVPVMSTPQGLRMLRAERFDLLVAPAVLIEPRMLKEEPRLVALQPPLVVKSYFAPVSPSLWQRQPDLVQALWQGLCRAGRLHAGQKVQAARCDAA
jgi:polar amino acid transport system substrate-binding protein